MMIRCKKSFSCLPQMIFFSSSSSPSFSFFNLFSLTLLASISSPSSCFQPPLHLVLHFLLNPYPPPLLAFCSSPIRSSIPGLTSSENHFFFRLLNCVALLSTSIELSSRVVVGLEFLLLSLSLPLFSKAVADTRRKTGDNSAYFATDTPRPLLSGADRQSRLGQFFRGLTFVPLPLPPICLLQLLFVLFSVSMSLSVCLCFTNCGFLLYLHLIGL